MYPSVRSEPAVDHLHDERHVKPAKATSLLSKKPAGKGKMGAKKFGAAKVSANFDEIEAKAETIEKEREQVASLKMRPVEEEDPQTAA